MRSAKIQQSRVLWPPTCGNLKRDPEAMGPVSWREQWPVFSKHWQYFWLTGPGDRLMLPSLLFILRVGNIVTSPAPGWTTAQDVGLWCGSHDLCPVENDSWTPDGTEQAAAMWLHGHLKCVKAGLVSIIPKDPLGMLSSLRPPFSSTGFGGQRRNLTMVYSLQPPDNRDECFRAMETFQV